MHLFPATLTERKERTMPLRNLDVPGILHDCEEDPRMQYERYPSVVPEKSQGKDVFVVSDLHIAAGTGKDGTYGGTENFFADGSFMRFLRNAHEEVKRKKAILIINGDFVDFLRIVRLPETDAEFASWQRVLNGVGISMTAEELRRSISEKEREYGLKTNDYKSVWKLAAAVDGHPPLFDGLAEWLAKGHKIILLKGNHDLEWYWPPVRNALRLILAERISGESSGTNLRKILTDTVLPNIRFIDHALLVDEAIYVEHGHLHDRFCHVVGEPTLGKRNHQELNLPFGSFFNRYLTNKIELDFPYLDNIRPQTNLLPLLFRERFFLGLKVLFVHLPFLLLIIPKGYYEYMLKRALFFALAIGIPILLTLVELWNIASGVFSHFAGAPQSPFLGFLKDQGINALLGLLGAAVSYGFTRLTVWLQLEEPGSLDAFAREKFDEMPAYRIITYGHTHNPDQFKETRGTRVGAHWFYNTGTWIPVIETSNAEVREDRSYCFLHLRNERGSLQPGVLRRWNDDAGRSEPLVMVRQKEQ